MSRFGSPGGSSYAEPDKQLVCNSEASEIYGAPVIPAPSLHAGVACTSSDGNHCTSAGHKFSSLELDFLFFLQANIYLFVCLFVEKINSPRLKQYSIQRVVELELKIMNVMQ